jgi:hypothetical protein
MKNIYEIFDEFDNCKTESQRMKVIGDNLSSTLRDVLLLTFHPNLEWYYSEVPESYRVKDIPPGMSYGQLSTELRKLYLFQKNHPEAVKLSEQKREQLFVEFLEALEPREAEVVIGIFNKDQYVKGLTYEFVKKAFPQLLP